VPTNRANPKSAKETSLKFCPHFFLISSLDVKNQSSPDYAAFGPLSNYCSECWTQRGLDAPEPYKFEVDNPFVYGFCDQISQVARRRGFYRDGDAREDIECDLRAHLIQKQSAIEQGIRKEADKQGLAPGDSKLATNYVRKVLQNFLKDRQQRNSEGIVIRNTTQSLSPEGLPVLTRSEEARQQAGELLTDLTGGCSASGDDDYSLDEEDVLSVDGPDSKSKRSPKKSENRVLFDTMLQQASSQIATLTGGRKDGFDVRLDLQKALSKLPAEESAVFSLLWLEDGDLLARPRTYPEVQRDLNLTLQNLRTLEMRAIQKLKPALGPAFFRRRQT
jgi:hypothetical protein